MDEDFRIETVPEAEAQGAVARLYDEARGRAGKVYNIVRAMSLRPAQLRSSMAFYGSLMFGESGLTRAERELAAVVVSLTNACDY